MLLTARNSCPVCGASQELCRTDTTAFDFNQGLSYLAPLLEAEGDSSKSILASMKPFKCGVCRARFLDPWLSLHSQSRVFIKGHPIHNVGWRSFLERVERNLTPDLQVDPEELIATLNLKAGGLLNYFELGCPFQGLLLHLSERSSLDEFRGISSQFGGMTPEHSRRFLWPARVFMRVASLAKNLAFIASKLRTYRDRFRQRYQKEPTLSTRDLSGLQRYFVPLGSTRFWGVNCSMFGESCAATAMSSLHATVIPHDELKKFGKIPNSCIGLFNVLDHQDDPLKLLQECLNQANVVVVLGHEPPLGIQHHFGLGSDFFENLPTLIRGLEVTRLSPDGANSLLYSLCLQ